MEIFIFKVLTAKKEKKARNLQQNLTKNIIFKFALVWCFIPRLKAQTDHTKGSFINDVTQYWGFSDPPTSSVTHLVFVAKYLCFIHSWLSRCSTARGPISLVCPGGPAKVEA